MKLRVPLLFLLILVPFFAISQVGIGTTAPSHSSILDIHASDKGLLIPRVDLGDLNTALPIDSPEKSLMVWNTDIDNSGENEGFYYWNGFLWVKIMEDEPRVFVDKYNSADITINANDPIVFDITSLGQGINSGNTFFEAPISGCYRVAFNLNVEKAPVSGIYSFFISKTQNPMGKIIGTTVRTEIPNQFTTANVSLSKIIHLDANDIIYLISQRRASILSESSFNVEYINK